MFNYTGHPFDQVIDLYFAQARMYNAEHRRWISVDPAKDALNWYVYCANDPLRYSDPTGLYARDAAVQYASDWHNSRNSVYYSYSQDCANFVSQSLFAGGIKMSSTWYSYKGDFNWDTFWWDVGAAGKAIINWDNQYWYDWDIAEPWRLASTQFAHFSDPSNGYINGEVLTITSKDDIKTAANDWGIQPGDLLYEAGSNGTNPHHAMIVTKVENGELYFAAHTNNRFNKALSEVIGNEQVKVIRIRDEAVLGYKL